MKKKISQGLMIILAVMFGMFFISPLQAAEVIYMNPSAAGEANGSTWADAYTDLQTAINQGNEGDEVWVTTGTYTPGNDSSATFNLKKGVAVYGGFAGTEITLNERDWKNNVTTLSGEIGTADDVSDNIKRVVSCNNTVDKNTLLDGFTITGGNGDKGAGIYNLRGSPVVANCTFIRNIATTSGGGMYNSSGIPKVINCIFIENTANVGGGMYNETSNTVVTNCIFKGNIANTNGGAMMNKGSSPTTANCLFVGNTADVGGGGIYTYEDGSPIIANCTFSKNIALTGSGGGVYVNAGSPKICNSIFWGNSASEGKKQNIYASSSSSTIDYNVIEGDSSFMGKNTTEDPVFFRNPDAGDDGVGDWKTPDDNDYGDLHLKDHTSPAVDAGSNSLIPADTADADGDGDTTEKIDVDLGGSDRRIDVEATNDTGNGEAPVVDRGAYEYEPPPPPTIASVIPNSGPIGTPVTIGGTNFMDGATEVRFGGTLAAGVTVTSDVQMTAWVGEGDTGYVLVTTPGGTATSEVSFTFVYPPEITSVDPALAGTGETVTITGNNLAGTTAVSFGITEETPDGTAATIDLNSITDTEIIAVVSPGTATGKIRVKTPGGTFETTSDELTIDEPPKATTPVEDVTVNNDGQTTQGTVDLASVFTDTDDDGPITKEVSGNTNPDIVTATVDGDTLTLVYSGKCGTSTITVQATSAQRTGTDDFIVTVSPMAGDMNCDKNINLEDAVIALKVLTGIADSGVYNADVNSDGKVDVEDLVYILNKILE
ncbi:IPT/TIG domain-containing protein [Desulfococcaceae bacterium HSG8]|nr:IPT/TIG domain-containing protein [Desulfococcaceae bacterium HSG8]